MQRDTKTRIVRKALYIAGVLAVLVFGFLSGIYFQRLANQRAESLVTQFLGLDEDVLKAPPIEFWRFPNSELQSSGSGGGIKLNGSITTPNTQTATWTTPASFEEVVCFYAEHLSFEDPDSFAERRPTTGGVSSSRLDPEAGPSSSHHVRDNRIPGMPHDSLRPIRAEALISRSRSYHVSVFITRADDENDTHVVVVYDPFTETEDNK